MRDSVIDEIKDKLDIVEVIGSYIKIQKAGANYKALCPFHQEKTPSFYISPSKQIFKCFGCGAGGSVFDFVMKIEGVEFGDALRILAKKAGVSLARENPALRSERQRLYEILELANGFFRKQLNSSKAGKEAREYLKKRGINDESIEKWQLGYAPDTWRGLSDFLISKGYKKEEIAKSGLASRKENQFSDIYDRFRGRIMFPIFDLNSQTIGFGGRITAAGKKEDVAKYLNTPNTLLYDKSKVLYGLNFAKMAIRNHDASILVEGYTDVILSHQAGVENVVSSSGTSLTDYQLTILKRYSQNLLTSFDMDAAGNSATKRGIDLAQQKGFNVRVITMPAGLDPADVASRNPKEWQTLVKKNKRILDFYFENTLSKFDRKTPEGKKAISDILLPYLRKIKNKILQDHWVKVLARQLEVSENAVLAELKKISFPSERTSGTEFSKENKAVLPKNSRHQLLEEKILSLIYQDTDVLDLITKEAQRFMSNDFQEVFADLKKIQDSEPDKTKAAKKLKDFLGSAGDNYPDNLKNFLQVSALMSEVEEEDDPKKEAQSCLAQIIAFGLKAELREISKAIQEAEAKKEDKKIDILMEKFAKKTKLLKQYQ